jgi:hypothetical protein
VTTAVPNVANRDVTSLQTRPIPLLYRCKNLTRRGAASVCDAQSMKQNTGSQTLSMLYTLLSTLGKDGGGGVFESLGGGGRESQREK